MEDYINKLNMYLPIDFGDEENNLYRQYLIGTFLENCENEKYQFALVAYHMMFMSFLYKAFWELKRFSYTKVERLCLANGNFKNIHAIFDASIIPEQTIIDQYLSLFGWHVKKKIELKPLLLRAINALMQVVSFNLIKALPFDILRSIEIYRKDFCCR